MVGFIHLCLFSLILGCPIRQQSAVSLLFYVVLSKSLFLNFQKGDQVGHPIYHHLLRWVGRKSKPNFERDDNHSEAWRREADLCSFGSIWGLWKRWRWREGSDLTMLIVSIGGSWEDRTCPDGLQWERIGRQSELLSNNIFRCWKAQIC